MNILCSLDLTFCHSNYNLPAQHRDSQALDIRVSLVSRPFCLELPSHWPPSARLSCSWRIEFSFIHWLWASHSCIAVPLAMQCWIKHTLLFVRNLHSWGGSRQEARETEKTSEMLAISAKRKNKARKGYEVLAMCTWACVCDGGGGLHFFSYCRIASFLRAPNAHSKYL